MDSKMERLADFINEGKYAKYLTKAKKKEYSAATSNKDYKQKFRELKAKLSEISKLMDKHIKLQQNEPLDIMYVGQVEDFNAGLDKVIEMIKSKT